MATRRSSKQPLAVLRMGKRTATRLSGKVIPFFCSATRTLKQQVKRVGRMVRRMSCRRR